MSGDILAEIQEGEITVAEAARLTNRSESAIYSLIQRGHLKSYPRQRPDKKSAHPLMVLNLEELLDREQEIYGEALRIDAFSVMERRRKKQEEMRPFWNGKRRPLSPESGARLKALRKAKGLTGTDLAEMADVPQCYISRCEHNGFTPSARMRRRLAEFLEVEETAIWPEEVLSLKRETEQSPG